MNLRRITAVLLVALCLMSMAGCGSPEKAIVGTWVGRQEAFGVSTEKKFVFNEDGTGYMSVVLGVELSTTYTITDTEITITPTSTGSLVDLVYSYTLKGDTLTLSDGEDTFTLERQK